MQRRHQEHCIHDWSTGGLCRTSVTAARPAAALSGSSCSPFRPDSSISTDSFPRCCSVPRSDRSTWSVCIELTHTPTLSLSLSLSLFFFLFLVIVAIAIVITIVVLGGGGGGCCCCCCCCIGIVLLVLTPLFIHCLSILPSFRPASRTVWRQC